MPLPAAPPEPVASLAPSADAPPSALPPAPRCANCGTPAGDAYCPHCGQEQTEVKEKPA